MSTDSRHLRISVAVLSQAHQIIDAEAFSYTHQSNTAYYGLFCVVFFLRQFYNQPRIFEKNVFSLFEFSFTWVVFLFGGRGQAWQEDCHKGMVTEACAVSPGEGDHL